VSARYKVQGTWDVKDTTPVEDADFSPKGTVVTETADLLDTRTGNRYQQGAFRVRVLRSKVKGLPRGATFMGETAWSRAEALHDDIVTALHFAEVPER
jgi:hypothetical protein